METRYGNAFVERYSVIPAEFSNGHFPIITIFTAMFMHGGLVHLLGNMLYLYIFGDNVEDNLGKGRFLLFYLLCGIGATIAQIAANPSSTVPNLGASGAIAGVLAAYLILFPRNRVRVLMIFFVMTVSAWFVLGLWVATQIFSAYTDIFHHSATEKGGVAFMAHVGGFFTGVVLVFIFRRKQAAAGISQRLQA